MVELVCKLHIGPVVLKWIRNYLTNKHQKVGISGEESKVISVMSGVPQGSVLSPLLFLIYIDDVTRVTLSDGTQMPTICYSICPEVYITLQNDINTVNNWFKCNYFTLNVSSYLVISRKKTRLYCHPPDLLLDDLCLERVESFKYLRDSSKFGFVMHHRSKHIESIISM